MATKTIDRPCHWLRKNTRSRRPEWILFVDGESNINPIHSEADIHTFRLGWACLTHYTPKDGLHVHGWHKITDPLQFWHIVSPIAYATKQLYIVSHNIDYDARVLHGFSILPGIGWPPSYIILADSCHFFTFEADKSRISLLDNLNYWQLSLEDLGDEFGIEKLEIDFSTCTDDELSNYCRRDVEILITAWQFWLEFLDDHDLGNWAITTAGQAWNAYRHRFMPCRIGIHNRADAIKLERDSYKGGRCEVWRVGNFTGGPFRKLDINGLYAYCMREYECPQKLVKVIVDVTPDYLRKLLDRYAIIADVIVETWEPVYPLHLNGHNVFPVGSFKTTLTTPELAFALDNRHLRGIGKVALYEKQHLFTAYIDYLTDLRQEYKRQGERGKDLLCKMLRNSLYGKFGQRGYKQEIIDSAPLDAVSVRRWIDAETGEKCTDWTFGGRTIRQTYQGESQDSFPGIASHVSAFGRMVLWDYAIKAGLENVYYADTDSLIVNDQGYTNLTPWIDPMRLGYLKVESTADNLEIIAKKSYRLGAERTLKGIKKTAVQQNDGRWLQTQFTSLKWGFSNGELDDVITYDVRKQEHATIYHGRVSDDNTVIPPEMSLDTEQVSSIIAPLNDYLWDWWIDPVWFQSLDSRQREPIPKHWFLPSLLEEPIF